MQGNEAGISEISHRLQSYTFRIESDKVAVSGLLLTNEKDNVITGSMINEFGVSAIDFTYSKKNGKIKLLNVVSFLNKWLIKMVLKNDLKFCIQTIYEIPFNPKHKYEIIHQGETVTIINRKQNLKYSFTPLNSKDTNDTE